MTFKQKTSRKSRPWRDLFFSASRKYFSLEALVWIAGLGALAIYQPGDSHISFCPLANLGFDFCPGCGLGRSVSYGLHGQLVQSWNTHPLGMVAIGVLTYRSFAIISSKFKTHGQSV
ncbi:MAG: DUF2752 domain-containing protein [Cyclobacteriaceae bacterium]